MIEITSFLLRHLYELMADNYNAASVELRLSGGGGGGGGGDSDEEDELETRSGACDLETTQEEREPEAANSTSGKSSQANSRLQPSDEPTSEQTSTNTNSALAFVKRHLTRATLCRRRARRATRHTRSLLAREQETNQQIVAFLINNQLPDLVCESVIELIFISVFLAVSWIFVMIIQLHCQQASYDSVAAAAHSYESARNFYCNTMFLNSLMYCNNQGAKLYSS